VKQELLALPEHISSFPDFSGARVARSLTFCVVFYRSFVLLAIVLSVLRFIDSNYTFGIFKLICSSLFSDESLF
jgi:hypothetical protein